ncbi:MAG TPA: menaquinone biosynthesis decarboxylase [Thermodesulfovibrionia bacterium]|nr:menaquinone biosynthesis decarboxylase [Thermodesulfovibrionia bacterium]
MAYSSLKEFITALEKAGELVRVRETVSPILEITEITDRVCKSKGGGRALLFESVAGSNMPVLINAFGSWKRLYMALGVSHIDDAADRVAMLSKMKPPGDFFGKLDFFRNLYHIKDIPPKIVKEAPCQEVVYTGDTVDLGALPILQCWPQDAGRFITMPVVVTKSLKTGARNAGMYRLQVYDKNTTGMHWQIHKDGSHFFQEYRKAKKRMPVAVAIGTEPVITYAATAPLPREIDEMLLAGFLRKKRVELVKCLTVDLEVPASSEIVLEGYVDPVETRLEGPFGDHTGYYSLEDYYPVFHITAITTRRNPVYLTTIVGKPPMEDCYLGKATERIFLPLLKTQVQELADINLPWEGVFHNSVVISIDKHYPFQARKVMSALWGLGQMSFAKTIAVVDDNIPVTNMETVMTEILNKVKIPDDVFITEGILDVLDHSSPTPLYGGKLGLDATTKIEGEPGYPSLSQKDYPYIDTEKLLKAIEQQIPEITALAVPLKYVRNPLAIVSYQKSEPGRIPECIDKLSALKETESIKIFLILDAEFNVHDSSVAAWKFFNNCDPRRDIYERKGRLFLDATKKLRGEGHDRKWPDDLEMDAAVKAKVDAGWKRYGIKLT